MKEKKGTCPRMRTVKDLRQIGDAESRKKGDSAKTESVRHYKESIEYLENESNCLYKIWTARSCQINGGSQTTTKRQRSIN